MMQRGLFVLILFVSLFSTAYGAPVSFERAKVEARQYVYHDRHQAALGTLYCGCQWEWVGRSGGRVDMASCGYAIRAQPTRAQRTEWEHIVPASNFGRARQCWQDGGRKNCNRTDPVFNAMEADLHNLSPAIGEVNADRSNYRFGVLPGTALQHGACDFRVDFSQRVAEPRDPVKGMLARIYFYMHDRYDLPMSEQQQRLLMAWDKQFPVSEWEKERDRRIATRMGHNNPFVIGERKWELGHRNHAEGIVTAIPEGHPALGLSGDKQGANADGLLQVRGNRNSKVYHLSSGCPSYDRIAPQNIVNFASEAEAIAAGYRKAGNCR